MHLHLKILKSNLVAFFISEYHPLKFQAVNIPDIKKKMGNNILWHTLAFILTCRLETAKKN